MNERINKGAIMAETKASLKIRIRQLPDCLSRINIENKNWENANICEIILMDSHPVGRMKKSKKIKWFHVAGT